MKRALCIAALVFLLVPVANALYIRPDLEMIPIERLLKNLGDKAEKEPKNVALRLNLARVHGMAYANKTDTATVWKDKLDQGAWFGYEPAFVPFAKEVAKAVGEAQEKEAKKHLEQAIEEYKAALKLEPKNLPAQLGLAWCVAQAGDKKAALEALRKVVDSGWETDKTKKFAPLGGHFITAEATDYLIPLLDA